MRDQRSPKSRSPWLGLGVIVGALLLGGTALCTVGTSAVTENYDGVTSWVNPIGAGSCCVGLVLLITGLVVWWIGYGANRERR